MFENPRRGRQARNCTENDPKILDLKSSAEQIIFRKLSLGAPEELAACNKGLYTKLHTILRLLMIGPVTSATVERSNSLLHFVKSCFRRTMREDRLNALSLLFIHKDVALDYNVIIDDYAKRNKRRMKFINPLQ